MTETVDEIQRRLSPEYLKYQAQETVRDTARGAKSNMFDTIKENPIPSLMAGLGVGWLIARGSQSSHQHHHPQRHRSYRTTGYAPSDPRSPSPYTSEYRREPYPYDEPYPNEGRESMHDHQGGASMTDKAGEIGHEARDKAQQVGRQAQHSMQRTRRQTQRQARRMERRAEHMLHENPLAVGAGALAVGALAGAMFPSTNIENEYMGESRDRVMHSVRSKADEAMHRAQDVAEKTAKEAKQTAKQEAGKQKQEMNS